MRVPAIAVLAATATGALFLAGCGSSDSESTATITKSAFVKQADAICAKGNKEINKAGNEIFGSLGQNQQPSKAQLEEFATGTLIPSVETQVAAISALPVPSGDEAQVQAILDAAQQAHQGGQAGPDLADRRRATRSRRRTSSPTSTG